MKYIIITLIILNSISYSNSGLKVEQYVLENGMSVILNPDNNASSVYGAVVIKGGGKQDPADATGIAHYLEHMLFKGTSELGTTDYKSEKVYLDSIEILYDDLGTLSDSDARLKIQKKINDLNIKASEYAIPNEFTKLLEGMGGVGVNAFTSNDVIAYISEFPGHQMGKWLDINSHRFESPVFRLFQSELETVYEEKNRAADNAFRRLFEEYFENFFKKHPYGQQTVLGSIDHLKNPSIRKMKEYYNQYYVANNMHLLLAGNFDIKAAKIKIDKTFGNLKAGPDPSFIKIDEEDFKGREVVNKRLTPIRFGIMGFRLPPPKHEDSITLQVIKNLFNNGSSTGLLDRLSVENKLLGSMAIDGLGGADHGAMGFMFIPKLIFQTFKGAENVVMKQIEKVKAGDFSDGFLQSIKLSMIQDHESGLENASGRLRYVLDMILNDYSWEEVISYPDRIKKIDKNEVIRISNKYFKDDYLVYRSKIGFPKKTKVDKPPFKPVKPKNSEMASKYAQRLEKIAQDKIKIDLVNFDSDIHKEVIFDNYHFYHNNNPINSIFTMRVEFGVGDKEIPSLKYAAGFGSMIGTEKYDFNTFKEELQKVGGTINFFNEGDYFGINVKGFDKYFEETVVMAGDFLKTMTVRKEDEKKLKKLIQDSILERKFESRESSVKGSALKDYALWGENSSFLKRSTIKDVKKMDTDFLLSQIKNAMKTSTRVFYTGTLDKNTVRNAIKENLVTNEKLAASNSPLIFETKLNSSNTVYFYNDKKAVQSQIYILSNGEPMSQDKRHISKAFNRYFGGSMSGLIFQEIREFKSLAYSARGSYITPFYLDGTGWFEGFMGTQADKTIDAIDTYIALLKDMPRKENRSDGIKSGLLQSMGSLKPSFRSLNLSIRRWEHAGYVNDPRKSQMEVFKELEFDDISSFYDSYINGKSLTITIVGNKDKIDMSKLAKYGRLVELKSKDLFN